MYMYIVCQRFGPAYGYGYVDGEPEMERAHMYVRERIRAYMRSDKRDL